MYIKTYVCVYICIYTHIYEGEVYDLYFHVLFKLLLLLLLLSSSSYLCLLFVVVVVFKYRYVLCLRVKQMPSVEVTSD
jgi:hypothetical protein